MNIVVRDGKEYYEFTKGCFVLKAVVDSQVQEKKISKDVFLDKFTTEEQGLIITSTDATVKALLFDIQLRPFIDLKNQKTIDAVYKLEELGLIELGRAAVILEEEF